MFQWGDRVRLRNSAANILMGQPEFLIALVQADLGNEVLSLNPLTPDSAPSMTSGNFLRGSEELEWEPMPADAGEHTPTLAAVANLAGQTAGLAFWQRQNDIVTVHGALTAQPTDPGETCTLRIDLPASSNLTAAGHLAGVCSEPGGRIEASTSPDGALLTFPGFSGSRTISYSYSYAIR